MALSPPVALLGLAVSFALPVVGFYRRDPVEDGLDWPRLRRILFRNWGFLGALVVFVLVAGGPEDIGLRVPSVGVFVDGFLFGFVAFAGTMVLVGLVLRYAVGVTAPAASLVVFEQPLSRQLAVAVSGAVIETTIFYGFTVEALFGLGAGPWVAGAAAATGVLLMRAQWSTRNALQWLPGAVVLSGVVVWSRSLLVVLLIRMGYDTITLVSGDASDYSESGS